MKSNEIRSNTLFVSLLFLLVIVGDFLINILPIYFIIIIIIGSILSLCLLGNEIIQKDKKRFLLPKIILLSTGFIMGYADLYFKLSKNYFHVFKNDMILSRFDSVYFSITTFTTTGYGDIYPISNSAKMFVASEMISGYILSTFIMAIIVIKFLHADK